MTTRASLPGSAKGGAVERRHRDRLPKRFDGLEISPCCVVGFANDTRIVEPCEPHEAEFWTVYGHVTGQGVEAFEDFATYGAARRYAKRLLRCNRHLERFGIYHPNGMPDEQEGGAQ